MPTNPWKTTIRRARPIWLDGSSKRQHWQPFRMGEVKQPEYVHVGENEVLLGRDIFDYEFETAVTIPHPPNRRMTIVIVGGQGSGKTVVAHNLCFDQLNFRWGHPILAIDPKLDTHSILKPNNNPHLIKILKENYHIKPKAFNVLHVVPKFMDLFGARGKELGNEVCISLKDFEPMDKDTRVATMCQILEVKTDEPAYAVVSEIMMSDVLPSTPQEFLVRMESIMEIQKIKSDRLKWKFNGLVNTKKFSSEHFDYAQKMKEHGIVALEGSIGDERTVETMTQGIFVNAAIYNVVNARIMDIRNGRRSKIPYIFMDEASNFAGREGLSAGIMTSISTKYRAINDVPGIGSVIVSQFLHELAPKIVSEAEWIICPKLTDARDIEIIKDRGSDNYLFDNMHLDPNDRPNDFCAFGRNGLSDFRLFKPLPKASWMGSA